MSEPGPGQGSRPVAAIAAAQSTVRLAASAVRHAGWWLTWHARDRPSAACRRHELASPAKGARRGATSPRGT